MLDGMCGGWHCVHVCAHYSPWPAASLAPLSDPPKRESFGCRSSPTARTPDNRHARGMHPTPWPHARHESTKSSRGRGYLSGLHDYPSQVGDGARNSTVATIARLGSSRAMSTERSYVGVEWHAKRSISPRQVRRDIPAPLVQPATVL